MKSEFRLAVLALQGDYQAHALWASKCIEKLKSLTVKIILVKKSEDLCDIDALIIPGGESGVFLKLISQELKDKLIITAKTKPTLVTCAGLILLAKKVSNPNQDSLKLLDIEVIRNAYGRQINSFITNNLKLSSLVKKFTKEVESVFIRAPQIHKINKDNVEVLIENEDNPILIRQGKIIAATYHPELSVNSDYIFKLLLDVPID